LLCSVEHEDMLEEVGQLLDAGYAAVVLAVDGRMLHRAQTSAQLVDPAQIPGAVAIAIAGSSHGHLLLHRREPDPVLLVREAGVRGWEVRTLPGW
jgi:hypothetical protein